MIFIFTDGRILCSANLLQPEDSGKYLEIEQLPEILPVEGKAGVVTGCNLITKEIKIEYFDIPDEPELIEPPIPQPTEQELINADNLLNQAEQIAKLNMINETLAVLLLNSTGGM